MVKLRDDLGLISGVVTVSLFLDLGSSDEQYEFTVLNSEQGDLDVELLVTGT